MAGRILLVEDDGDLGITLKLYLELHGYQVTVVGDAESALDTLEHASIDVLITDDRLPGQSGLMLAARLTSRPRRPPVIAFTGSDDPEQLEDSRLFAGVVRKPCDPDLLVRLVRNVLGSVA